jgi:pre-mRNA-splicing factor ISY1
MARNMEKANLMLNRWTSMKDDIAKGGGGGKDRRPYLASECKVLPEAERWRREVIRDITKTVAELQNAGLGDARLRDMNDLANKLLREKGHWERQIKALGGPDYAATAPKIFDADGRELPGSRGYKYFGAAKDLPGVRELFAAAAAKDAPRRTRGAIMRAVTPDYYGFRDEDDGVLVAAETKRSRELRGVLQAGWAEEQAAAKRARLAAAGGEGAADGDDAAAIRGAAAAAAAAGASGAGAAGGGGKSMADVEAAVAARKRELLLARYVSPELLTDQAAARDMAGGRGT